MKLTLPYVYLTRHKISHSLFLGAMCTTGSYTFRKSHTQSLVSVLTLCKNFKTELHLMLNHSQTCIICQLWGKLNDLLQHSLTSKYSFEQPLRVNKEKERIMKKSILFEYRKQKYNNESVFYLKIKKKIWPKEDVGSNKSSVHNFSSHSFDVISHKLVLQWFWLLRETVTS